MLSLLNAQHLSVYAVSCTVAKTLSFFLSSGQNVWTSDVLIRTSQSRKLLAQRDKFEKKLL